MMKRPIKDFVAFVFVSAVCSYAIWSGLQSVAIMSMIFAFCILYKPTISRAAEISLNLLGRTSRAKYGSFEMEVEQIMLGTLIQSPNVPNWVKALLSEMSSRHLGLLLALSKAERIRINHAVIGSLRDLRSLGLLEHDQSSMSKSEFAWLSAAGHDLVKALIGEAHTYSSVEVDSSSDSAPSHARNDIQ